jgi:non-ribosomal peptide synthase protein (TIGR01720 family)
VSDAAVPPLATDNPVAPHGYGQTETLSIDLGPAAANQPDNRIVAGLLAALAVALHAWDGRRLGRVLLTTHGRHSPFPGVDPSRTVGWFTAEFPVLLACPGHGPAAIAAIEAELAAVPSKGLGWGVLRWMAPQPIAATEEEVSLNYLGILESPPDHRFRLSARLPSASIGGMERHRLLELDGGVSGGRLQLTIRFAPHIHRRRRIEGLAETIATAFHL